MAAAHRSGDPHRAGKRVRPGRRGPARGADRALPIDPGQRARSYSKGSNRQKVALIAAFMTRPDVLLLDEPSAGLDPLMEAEFQALARGCRSGADHLSVVASARRGGGPVSAGRDPARRQARRGRGGGSPPARHQRLRCHDGRATNAAGRGSRRRRRAAAPRRGARDGDGVAGPAAGETRVPPRSVGCAAARPLWRRSS